MEIVSVKEGTGSQAGDPVIRIGLSDGSLFSFKPVYLAPEYREAPLFPGRELTGGEEGALRFAAACYRAEKLALRLLARAEQNSRTLAIKLGRRGQDRSCVQAALERLEGLGLLDDHRYALLWLRSRLGRRSATPRRLETGLRARGIDRRTASAALEEALDGERELAMLKAYLEKNRLGLDDDRRSLRYRLKAEGFSGAVLDRWREEGAVPL